jgi:prepilin signal peptidase PulO-like enzyme (type II secretory pathway)
MSETAPGTCPVCGTKVRSIDRINAYSVRRYTCRKCQSLLEPQFSVKQSIEVFLIIFALPGLLMLLQNTLGRDFVALGVVASLFVGFWLLYKTTTYILVTGSKK